MRKVIDIRVMTQECAELVGWWSLSAADGTEMTLVASRGRCETSTYILYSLDVFEGASRTDTNSPFARECSTKLAHRSVGPSSISPRRGFFSDLLIKPEKGRRSKRVGSGRFVLAEAHTEAVEKG